MNVRLRSCPRRGAFERLQVEPQRLWRSSTGPTAISSKRLPMGLRQHHQRLHELPLALCIEVAKLKIALREGESSSSDDGDTPDSLHRRSKRR
jgi:hypothetical protein